MKKVNVRRGIAITISILLALFINPASVVGYIGAFAICVVLYWILTGKDREPKIDRMHISELDVYIPETEETQPIDIEYDVPIEVVEEQQQKLAESIALVKAKKEEWAAAEAKEAKRQGYLDKANASINGGFKRKK